MLKVYKKKFSVKDTDHDNIGELTDNDDSCDDNWYAAVSSAADVTTVQALNCAIPVVWYKLVSGYEVNNTAIV